VWTLVAFDKVAISAITERIIDRLIVILDEEASMPGVILLDYAWV
jgi:hypothetical protein